MTKDATYFKDQLAKQLGFIKRSCKLYDQGSTEEAIRIATSLRVLFYDTGTSTSLLTHLGMKQDIKLLTSTQGISSPKEGKLTVGWTGVSLTTDGIRPPLGSGSYKDYVSIREWLEMILHSNNPKDQLRRIDIILEAANKDGGAHVDESKDLHEAYVQLGRSTSIGTLVVNDVSVPLPDVHLAHLRQFGYEILNSPDLLKITA